MKTIEEIMTKPVQTVHSDTTLEEIQAIFSKSNFRHLLVVNHRRLDGIISDRDLLKAISPYLETVAEQHRDAITLQKKAHQIMTRQPITVYPDTTIPDAIELLLNNGLSCLPVVGRQVHSVQGIVSWKDILRHFSKYFNQSKKGSH